MKSPQAVANEESRTRHTHTHIHTHTHTHIHMHSNESDRVKCSFPQEPWGLGQRIPKEATQTTSGS